jgi:hypothetical protein
MSGASLPTRSLPARRRRVRRSRSWPGEHSGTCTEPSDLARRALSRLGVRASPPLPTATGGHLDGGIAQDAASEGDGLDKFGGGRCHSFLRPNDQAHVPFVGVDEFDAQPSLLGDLNSLSAESPQEFQFSQLLSAVVSSGAPCQTLFANACQYLPITRYGFELYYDV